jgi:hypothetical protein
VLAIGLVGALAFLVEGALEGWSAIFLARKLDAGPALAGLGPAVFAGAMATGRFTGQAVRLADRTLLAGGGLLSAVGCLITATAPVAPVALVGLARGGAGVSLAAPILFGAAGRGRPDAAAAIATVTTIGYLGLLAGPPLVGGVAQAVSLRGSFAMLAVLATVVAIVASRLRI